MRKSQVFHTVIRQTICAETSTVFRVTDGFLQVIKSYTPATPPLVEDSASDNDATPETDLKLAAVYLVEPLRASSAVLKFSGTLGQRTRSGDKRTATILALSHFVVDNTACKYMFADIQGVSLFTLLTCHIIDIAVGIR